MQYSDAMLTLLTFCVLIGTLGLALVISRLSSTLSRLDRFADRAEALAPEVEKLVGDARDSLASAEQLADRLHDVAGDAKAVSTVARKELVPVIHRLSETGSAAVAGVHHITALVAATRAGLNALGANGHHRKTNQGASS